MKSINTELPRLPIDRLKHPPTPVGTRYNNLGERHVEADNDDDGDDGETGTDLSLNGKTGAELDETVRRLMRQKVIVIGKR